MRVEQELEPTKNQYESYKKTQGDLLVKIKQEALTPRVEAMKELPSLRNEGKPLKRKKKENEVFPHLRPPKIFFKNQALSLLYPYGALSSCKTLEKTTSELSLRYLTD